VSAEVEAIIAEIAAAAEAVSFAYEKYGTDRPEDLVERASRVRDASERLRAAAATIAQQPVKAAALQPRPVRPPPSHRPGGEPRPVG